MTQSIQDDRAWPEASAARGTSLYLSTILLSVPVVCFTGALLADIAYFSNPDPQWTNFAAWLLVFGILFLGLSIAFGIIGFLATLRRRRRVSNWLFGLFLLAAAGTGLFDNFIHSRDGWASVWPTGLLMSAITVVLLGIAIFFKSASLGGSYIVRYR